MADNEAVAASADDLTPAEKAYLESGGENADGLLAENNTIETKLLVEPVKPAAEKPTAEKVVADKAPVADSEDDEEDDLLAKDPKATVPYQKFKREQKKLQSRLAAAEKARTDEIEALKKQLGETNERFARGDERLRLLSEVIQQPQPQTDKQEDPEPDPNEDIIGWAQWSRRENQRKDARINDLQNGIQRTQTTIASTESDTQMQRTYQSDAIAFARETPDFGPAYNFLITARAGMLEDQGFGPDEIKQILFNEEKGLVQRAIEQKKRPAQAIYALAKRMGYQAKAPAQNGNGAANGAANGNAQNANGHEAPARAPSVAEEIERIAKGQASNKSLSDAGGGAASELTVEALANMSDKEFQALYSSKRGQIERVMGKLN